ncbi:Hypothetical_protein [Hexamita inflata]|uniref:Hypothetical_protein n=1 Tax=Hexamita inflata TaxID=28002 RepID=A0AA86P8K3_9EUKA|nr:Hypothetical protein HINF_LOCUS21606 [Hexamita inflata]
MQMIIVLSMQINCQDQNVVQTFKLNGSTNFSQECIYEKAKCIQFQYADLPTSLKNVFQLVDRNGLDSYNMCDQFETENICKKYCVHTCAQIQTQSQPMKYNLTMKSRHGSSVVTQVYLNETATSNYSYVCKSFGTGRIPDSTLIIIITVIGVFAVIFIVVLAGYLTYTLKQKRNKKNWDEIERLTKVVN